jgi:hypothetical protein
VESNGIFYVQIASEKLYWAGLAALYSSWRLRSATDDSSVEPIQQLDLWNVVQDVLYSIRTLSERWDDGKILAKEFELASKRILKDSGQEADLHILFGNEFPAEVKNFANYVSLTSMRAARREEDIGAVTGLRAYDGELRQLVSDMLMGSDSLARTLGV